MSKLIPFFHKVLIKRIEEKSDEIAKLGSILVAKRIDVPNPKGVVVAVGPAFKETDKPFCAPGQQVLIPDYKGKPVIFEGEKLEMYREDEIIAIIKE